MKIRPYKNRDMLNLWNMIFDGLSVDSSHKMEAVGAAFEIMFRNNLFRNVGEFEKVSSTFLENSPES